MDKTQPETGKSRWIHGSGIGGINRMQGDEPPFPCSGIFLKRIFVGVLNKRGPLLNPFRKFARQKHAIKLRAKSSVPIYHSDFVLT